MSGYEEIDEASGNGAFYNDGNTTTGYIWNSDWDDYDKQKYYLDKLEGWDFVDDIPSEREKKNAVDQKLPIDNHKDTTDKYNRILKYDLKSPIDFLKESLLMEGGAYGHMAHPFDIDWVKTGKDLVKVFAQSAEYLKKGPASVKIDGVNASIRLVDVAGKKMFVMDRGSNKPLDVKLSDISI